MKVREFQSVNEAVSVLGRYTTRARLEALEELGIDLDAHTHAELAERVCASREKVVMAMGKMGRHRTSGRRSA